MGSWNAPNLKGTGAVVTGASRVLDKTGGVFAAGELALEYGFTDVDGRQVPPFRFPEDGDP